MASRLEARKRTWTQGRTRNLDWFTTHRRRASRWAVLQPIQRSRTATRHAAAENPMAVKTRSSLVARYRIWAPASRRYPR